MSGFADRLVRWQRSEGRHDLPWQESRDPYAIWVSEIMLQQTQVASVIPYYRRFMERFPDLAALARASQDEILAHWSGLGYYSRARNLHRAAQLVVERHGGSFPRAFADILALPGIGRSTAAAVAVFAFGERRAILDGNVRRVLARHLAVGGDPREAAVADLLWRSAEALLPQRDIEDYTQGLMDLGATVCTRSRPRCETCPVGGDCLAWRQGRQSEFPGSRPKKPLPERETVMLLLWRRGEIFLEKRPPSGIWGGMWSLPEALPQADWMASCRERFGFEAELKEALPMMRHSFTHFRLHIRPLCAAIREIRPQAREPQGVWLGVEDALGAALPTPVRKLILACARPGPERSP